jgi:hypothetical protein
VIDVYGMYEDAIKEGYAKFGVESFLVKQIQTTVPWYTLHHRRAN